MTFPTKSPIQIIQTSEKVGPTATNRPTLNLETNIDSILTFLSNSSINHFEFDQAQYLPATRNFVYSGGKIKSSAGVVIVTGSTLTLTANNQNFVQFNDDTGLVVNSTSGFSLRNVPLWKVTLDVSGNITDLIDYRSTLSSHVNDSELVDYNNSVSGLTATNTKSALDELKSITDTSNSNISSIQTTISSGTVYDSSRLNNQLASYYLDATNINAGTLNSARLSGTYAIDISGNAATLGTKALGVNANKVVNTDANGLVTLGDLTSDSGIVLNTTAVNTGTDTSFTINRSGTGSTVGVLNGIVVNITESSIAASILTGISSFLNQSGTISLQSYAIYGANNNSSGTRYDFYAAGLGTGYGPFTGAHDGLILKDETVEIGDIVVDVTVVAKRNLSNTICENTLSNVANQSGALGVITELPCALDVKYLPAALIDASIATKNSVVVLYDRICVNAVGEGQINVVNEGGNIDVGDLIVTSSIAGKGMKQSDDIVRNITVAKARESATWNVGDNSVKQIACIYLCG